MRAPRPGARRARRPCLRRQLLGAALGAVAVIPLMQGIPTPPLIAALAILPLSAAVVLAPRDRKVLLVSGAIASVILALLVSQRPFRLRYTKFQEETVEPAALREVDPHGARRRLPAGGGGARSSAATSTAGGWGAASSRQSPTASGSTRTAAPARQSSTGAAGRPSPRSSPTTSPPSPTSSAGLLDHVAIVDGGGGRDILTAAGMGARAIDVIELNSYIAGAVRTSSPRTRATRTASRASTPPSAKGARC